MLWIAAIAVLPSLLEGIPGTPAPTSQAKAVAARRSGSVKAMGAEIARIRKQGRRVPNYLEAARQYHQVRAFPFDSVDWTAGLRTQAARGRMPKARIQLGTGALAKWEYIGPHQLQVPYRVYYGEYPLSGRVSALAIDPTDTRVLYLGAPMGGVWKSVDGGQSWRSLSSDWAVASVNSITIHPGRPKTLFVGLGDLHGWIDYGMGLLRSDDGGETWEPVAPTVLGTMSVNQVTVDPDDPRILLAAAGSRAGQGDLFRSIDGGKTWKSVRPKGERPVTWGAISYSVPDAQGRRRYYATTVGKPIATVYRSEDRGLTWQPTTRVPDFSPGEDTAGNSVAASATQPNTVYVLDGSRKHILRSYDAGKTWQTVGSSLDDEQGNFWSQASYNYTIACGKRLDGKSWRDVVAVGELDLAQSRDGGTTWQSLGGPSFSETASRLHNDQHIAVFDPRDPERLYIGNDGGLFRYDRLSAKLPNITPLNRGLAITQFYSGAWHPTDPNWALGGAQDNANPASTGDLSRWVNPGGGDGAGTAIDPRNPRRQVLSVQNYGRENGGSTYEISSTEDGWATTTPLKFDFGEPDEPVKMIGPLILHPANPDHLYIATRSVHRYDFSTKTWSAGLGGHRLDNQAPAQAIAGAPSDEETLYVSTVNGLLWMTQDAGSTWKRVDGDLPERVVTAISVDPNDPNRVLVGVSGTGSEHLWQCDDTSAANPTWQPASGKGVGTLPDVPVNAIARDPADPDNQWWVGSDFGVFRTQNAGETWQDATRPLGLPPLQVNSIEVTPGTRYVNIATYARGMWRLALPAAQGIVATPTLAQAHVRRGGSTTLTVRLSKPAPQGGLEVLLASSDVSRVTVPRSAVVKAGQTEASVAVKAAGDAPIGPVTITAQAATQVQTTLRVTGPRITGTVRFDDLAGMAPLTFDVAFRTPEGRALGTGVAQVRSDGTFEVEGAPDALVDASFQVGTWLRRTVRLDLRTADARNVPLRLVNGDANGDNVVNDLDGKLVSASMSSRPGDRRWNAYADLNRDGRVDFDDAQIVTENAGRKGDR